MLPIESEIPEEGTVQLPRIMPTVGPTVAYELSWIATLLSFTMALGPVGPCVYIAMEAFDELVGEPGRLSSS